MTEPVLHPLSGAFFLFVLTILDGSRVYSMSLKTRGSSGSLLANSLSLCHHVKKASFRDVMRLRLLSTQK